MRFSSILSLAMPAVALAQNTTTTMSTATTTTSSATASSTVNLEAVCEEEASTYADACPQCLYTCADSSVPDQCYYSVFSAINYIQSMCEAGNGYNCRDRAIDEVCSGSS